MEEEWMRDRALLRDLLRQHPQVFPGVLSPHLPLEDSAAATISRCHGRRSRLTRKSVLLRREKRCHRAVQA
jgi:hypothetical protein